MFSSMEMAVAWAAGVLGYRAATCMPRDYAGEAICLVDRTGGELDYPHDSPEISFSVWARSEAEAESGANALAIACKTMPPGDWHVNAVGVPRVFSYGREDGGWFVWQTTVPFQVRLQD